jgi:hypothetical protein
MTIAYHRGGVAAAMWQRNWKNSSLTVSLKTHPSLRTWERGSAHLTGRKFRMDP